MAHLWRLSYGKDWIGILHVVRDPQDMSKRQIVKYIVAC